MPDDLIIMLVVADEEACCKHQPKVENVLGSSRPYRESPDRLARLLFHLRLTSGLAAETSSPVEFEVVSRGDHGWAPITAVHDAAFVMWLKTCYARWIAMGGDTRGVVARISYHSTFRSFGEMPEASTLSIDGQTGLFSWDMGHTVALNTWQAAYAAAQVALSAAAWLNRVHTGPMTPAVAPFIFAATRPPGHHASTSTTGGYCYLNNAAIAARWLSSQTQPATRVAILDLDAHFGNGTAEIFYTDPLVYYTSLHAENAFPHFGGRACETGTGEGMGTTRNYPLPIGSDESTYMAALEDALLHLKGFEPVFLLVCLGVDTYVDDPFQLFKLEKSSFNRVGTRVAQLGLPTLVLMEGGYNIEALPMLYERWLAAFAVEAHRLGKLKSHE